MELLAGFSVIVGSGLLDATSIQYGMFWLLLVSGVVGMAVALLIAASGLSERRSRAALLLGGAATALVLSLPVSRGNVSVLAAFLLLTLAYWRGSSVTEEPPVYEEVQRRFGYGFGVLFLGILWVIARGIIFQHAIWQMLAVVGISYTLSTMVALGMARLEQIREPGATQAVILALAAQLGFLVVVSFATLELFSIDIAGWLGNLAQPASQVLGRIVAAGLTPFVAVALWLIDLVHPHTHAIHHLQRIAPGVAPHGNGKRLHAHPSQSVWYTIGGIAFVLAILVLIGVLIWRTLPHLPHRRYSRGYREERRWLWSPATVWSLLLAWLQALLGLGRSATTEVVQTARRRVLGPEYPADPVRRIYAQLLHRASSAGLSRPPFTTPQEFQVTLARAWPAASADFAAVTEAYVRRRYGEVAFHREEVLDLRRRWRQASAVMRRERTIPIALQKSEVENEVPPELLPSTSTSAPEHAHTERRFSEAISHMRGALVRFDWSRWFRQAGLKVIAGVLLVLAPIIVFVVIATVVWHL